MKPNDTALRKRSQIAKANRTMFIWVAVASALVSFAVITSIFLGQKLIFNEKILLEKNRTVSTLKANNAIVSDLEVQVRVLDTNTDLAKAKASQNDQAIQVILDALPADANSLALGGSLQNKLLAGIPGLTQDTIQVDPVQGVETLGDSAVVDASATGTENQITFTFSVTGNQAALTQVLTNLERSIRTIDITHLTIENQGTSQVLTVQGRAFYEPNKTVELRDKVVKP